MHGRNVARTRLRNRRRVTGVASMLAWSGRILAGDRILRVTKIWGTQLTPCGFETRRILMRLLRAVFYAACCNVTGCYSDGRDRHGGTRSNGSSKFAVVTFVVHISTRIDRRTSRQRRGARIAGKRVVTVFSRSSRSGLNVGWWDLY
jgi:hypothetical protein